MLFTPRSEFSYIVSLSLVVQICLYSTINTIFWTNRRPSTPINIHTSVSKSYGTVLPLSEKLCLPSGDPGTILLEKPCLRLSISENLASVPNFDVLSTPRELRRSPRRKLALVVTANISSSKLFQSQSKNLISSPLSKCSPSSKYSEIDTTATNPASTTCSTPLRSRNFLTCSSRQSSNTLSFKDDSNSNLVAKSPYRSR